MLGSIVFVFESVRLNRTFVCICSRICLASEPVSSLKRSFGLDCREPLICNTLLFLLAPEWIDKTVDSASFYLAEGVILVEVFFKCWFVDRFMISIAALATGFVLNIPLPASESLLSYKLLMIPRFA